MSYAKSIRDDSVDDDLVVNVTETDMDENMTTKCVELTRRAFSLYPLDKEVATYIKDNAEKEFGATWHCIVGKSYGSRVSYEQNHFILLKKGNYTIMIFKCGY